MATDPYFVAPGILSQLMYQKRCVAYVGAGFSMACGMPSWWGLVKRLIEFGEQWVSPERLVPARAAMAGGDLPMTATLIREVLTPSLVNDCLNDTFGSAAYARAPHDQKQQMRHRMNDLVRASWAGIITTNYDSLIERALSDATEGTHWVDDLQIHDNHARLAEALRAAGEDRLFFVKLHGSITGPDTVLTTEDYDEIYLRSPRSLSE